MEVIQYLSPALAFSKITVVAPMAAITEIKGWKLEDDSATDAMHKILQG